MKTKEVMEKKFSKWIFKKGQESNGITNDYFAGTIENDEWHICGVWGDIDYKNENSFKYGETNAQLICDAVNGTAGIGINPNAVKEMKEALEAAAFILYRADKGTAGNRVYNQIQQALKNSEL